MEVYGLTGGIGSGKSAVAALLEDYGIPVVSADELSRIVVARGSEGLRDVVDRFGPEVLDEHGDLDRRKMAAVVFSDPARRRELEAILHPRIRERFEQVLDALEKAGHEIAVYEVPLLFEKNLQGEMKAVILVTADEALRIARVRARDDVTQTEVRARMAAQMPEPEKRRKADYVIENDGNLDDLRREVEFMLERFLRVPNNTRARPGSVHRRDTEEVPVVDANEVVAVDDDPPPSKRKTLPPSTSGPPSKVETQPGVRVPFEQKTTRPELDGPPTLPPPTVQHPAGNSEEESRPLGPHDPLDTRRRTVIVTGPNPTDAAPIQPLPRPKPTDRDG